MTAPAEGPASNRPGPLPREGDFVDIRYSRIGKPQDTYRLLVLDSTPDCVVTFQPRTPIDQPIVVDELTILEPRSPIIWFTFPGKWHDIGLFYRNNGAHTGMYANVLTPVDFVDVHTWETTDLCLDVWVPRWGSVRILDEDELSEAEEAGQVEGKTAERARAEAGSLVHSHSANAWPPPVVGEWSLARALSVLQAL